MSSNLSPESIWRSGGEAEARMVKESLDLGIMGDAEAQTKIIELVVNQRALSRIYELTHVLHLNGPDHKIGSVDEQRWT